uniref:Uncharacterized protein n=1 Tax=Arundo donax TaxID=35708 RepID=A0A0A9HHU0_ARUDO
MTWPRPPWCTSVVTSAGRWRRTSPW